MNCTSYSSIMSPIMVWSIRSGLVLLIATGFLALNSGCKKNSIDSALNSDANGFVCSKCSAKFYLPSDIFPGHCPQCKAPDIDMVMGYVCGVDSHTTIAPRNKRGGACEKCGKVTTVLSLPREADLKAWGAVKRTYAEVN